MLYIEAKGALPTFETRVFGLYRSSGGWIPCKMYLPFCKLNVHITHTHVVCRGQGPN